MKRIITFILAVCTFTLVACGSNRYVLTEKTFFLVMTNVQYYPEQYVGKDFEYDCFTYSLKDIGGREYTCGVRKCSAGYGCTCGQDTIIGFILDYDGYIPEPVNQSGEDNFKTWVHLKGKISSANKTDIKIYAYKDGNVDYNTVETISFLTFDIETIEKINDYSQLSFYVTK